MIVEGTQNCCSCEASLPGVEGCEEAMTGGMMGAMSGVLSSGVILLLVLDVMEGCGPATGCDMLGILPLVALLSEPIPLMCTL